MKNISAVVLNPGGLGSFEEQMLYKSMDSVKMAGIVPIDSDGSDNPVALATKKDLEFCHFIRYGTIIMPSFYEASLNMCGKFDYAFCHCMQLGKNEILKTPTPDNFLVGQIIVKTWVLKELGGKGVGGSLKRVLAEYRGIEVPHIMTIEVA